MHCTVRCCAAWAGPLSGMNPKDLIGCTTRSVWRYPGTRVPWTPARPSRCARMVQCRNSTFVRSLVRERRRRPPRLGINLHNAQRSNPAVASPGTTLHWTTLHDIIQHYITLHYTSNTRRRPALRCLSSACLSVAQSVSSRLWYHPIPPATACRPSHSRPRPHTQTQTQFADLGQTSLVPTVSQRLRPISFLSSFLPPFVPYDVCPWSSTPRLPGAIRHAPLHRRLLDASAGHSLDCKAYCLPSLARGTAYVILLLFASLRGVTCRSPCRRPGIYLPHLRMRRSVTDDRRRDLRHFANVIATKGVAAVLTSLLYFKQK